MLHIGLQSIKRLGVLTPPPHPPPVWADKCLAKDTVTSLNPRVTVDRVV